MLFSAGSVRSLLNSNSTSLFKRGLPENPSGLSQGAIAAIAVTVSVGTVVLLLTLYLVLAYRRRRRRASLEAIGAQNLYSTPKSQSQRSSQIVVTREVSHSTAQLPRTSQTPTPTPLRGSYRSDRPLLRGSYQSTTSPTPKREAPPRPARPSWPASVLEGTTTPDLAPSYAPLSRPVPIYSPAPQLPLPFPPSTCFFAPEITNPLGTGQVVNTYRHPTPVLGVGEQEDFMALRERAEVERALGANRAMMETGWRREWYVGYGEGEDVGREAWRTVGRGVVLEGEAGEFVEWSRVCGEVGRAL